jgi:hypothetical protein
VSATSDPFVGAARAIGGSLESEKFVLRDAYPLKFRVSHSIVAGRLRWALAAACFCLASGAILEIVLSAYWLPPPLWTPARVGDALFVPMALFLAYAFARGLGTKGEVASELQVTPDGLVVSYVDLPERRLSWTSPTLHGALVRRSGDRVLGGRTALALAIPAWRWPVLLDSAAFDALNRRVHELGLVLREFTREKPPLRAEIVEFGAPNTALEPLRPERGARLEVSFDRAQPLANLQFRRGSA